MRWFRERKRKEIGKRQGENKMKIGHSQVNNSVILRISYVYLTYMLRISYVIDSGKTASMKGENGKLKSGRLEVEVAEGGFLFGGHLGFGFGGFVGLACEVE